VCNVHKLDKSIVIYYVLQIAHGLISELFNGSKHCFNSCGI